MIIIKRFKNSKGSTIGYELVDGEAHIQLDSTTTVQLGKQGIITNANLLENGEFRAKDGYTIDTIVDKKEFKQLPVANNQTYGIPNGKYIDIDYYGKRYINICKRIRMYAVSGNIEIDDRPHKANGGANMHLLELIKSCGYGLKEFISHYLSNIQPYSLEPFQGNKVENSIWIADVGYRMKLIIKINEVNRNKPLVVSFHESNVSGSYIGGHKIFDDKPCAVIVDTVSDNVYKYMVSFTVQRGFIKLNIRSNTPYYNNGVALVDYKDISSEYESVMQFLIKQLVSSYSVTPSHSVTTLINTNINGNISFTATGADLLNNMFLISDLYSMCKSSLERACLLEVAENLIAETPIERRIELKAAITNSINIGKVKPNKMLGFIAQSL